MKKSDYIEKLTKIVRERAEKLTVKELRVLVARHTTPEDAGIAPKAKKKRKTVRKSKG